MRHLDKGVKKTRGLLRPDNVAFVLRLRGLRLDGGLRSRRVMGGPLRIIFVTSCERTDQASI